MKTVYEIKAILKAAFPGTKFQVRTNHGTVYVSWTDGASWTNVNRKLGGAAFCNKYTTKAEQGRLVAYCRQHLQDADRLVIDAQMRWAEIHMENPGADLITVSWR